MLNDVRFLKRTLQIRRPMSAFDRSGHPRLKTFAAQLIVSPHFAGRKSLL
jgi:hypothetical protein